MQSQINRRKLLQTSLAAEAGLVIPSALWTGAAKATDLDQELERGDRTLFPSNPLAALGAVLGGLVGFAITGNPVVILAELVGATVIGGVERAAGHYLSDRSRTFAGSVEAVQNAVQGDFRADNRRAEPHRAQINIKTEDISAQIDRVSGILTPLASQYTTDQLPDRARGAVDDLSKVIDELNSVTEVLAGYTSKHRDTGVVYIEIGRGCGLANQEVFRESVGSLSDQVGKLKGSLLPIGSEIQRLAQLASQLNGRRQH